MVIFSKMFNTLHYMIAILANNFFPNYYFDTFSSVYTIEVSLLQESYRKGADGLLKSIILFLDE